MKFPRILTFGESALTIEFGDRIAPELNLEVRALDDRIRREPWRGLIEAVPTYRSLLVHFDPLVSSPDEVRSRVESLLQKSGDFSVSTGTVKKVPTVYDGEDLAEVCAHVGLSRQEVIEHHSREELMVYMLGFSPGFAYMGLLPEVLATPRRACPRTRVPAGTVAIARQQTCVYPSANPSGWHVIGRASLPLFDPNLDPPTFFQPGDRVQFVPTETLEEPRQPVIRSGAQHGLAAIEVIKRRAPQTTVQDLGRPGYQRFGVPVSGALDVSALRAANLLVGNEPGAAGLEATIAGPPVFRFLRPIVFATAGADLGAVLKGPDSSTTLIVPYRTYRASEGAVLRFTERRSGARAYLAIAGGIDVAPVLSSRATYLPAELGGVAGRALLPGDVLCALPMQNRVTMERRWPEEHIPRHEDHVTVRVIWGPQDDYFTPKARETLMSEEYEVTVSSDRWGCRLDGPSLEHSGESEIVSDGMMPGAIQVPPNGKPIMMLADRATTGGYPKIATVVGPDIAKLGQLMPGGRVRFQSIGVESALSAAGDERRVEEKIARDLGA